VASPTTVLLLHGTTRAEKSWPVDAWSELGRQLVADGHAVVIPWGTKHERTTAERIAVNIGDGARVLPEMSIGELAARVQNSLGVIGVDSGLMHLSVALGRPTVAVMTASHLPRFSAARFAPFWAAHAQVVASTPRDPVIAVADVLAAWRGLMAR
jgi:heptosyltransferase-1